MNNDYKAFKANQSSMSSNNPIANRTASNYSKRLLKGNKYIYPALKNQNISPNKNNQFNRRIKYPYNKGPVPDPYDEEIITGYFVNPREEQRFVNENGGEEIEIEENNVENGEERNDLNDAFIGDSEFVRMDTPEDRNNYSPNQNGQDLYALNNLRNINNDLDNLNRNNRINREYYEDPNENPEEMNEEENEEYIIRSPEQDQENYFRTTNYNNFNNQVYQKRRVLGNLRDSASSEAYANKSFSRATLTDYRNSGIYIKPKTAYNNANINNGISTEERGIESQRDSSKKVLYDNNYEIIEESPIYNYPKVEQQEKGGKVDLNFSLNKLKNMTKNKSKEKYDMTLYENNLDKIVKIQATFRYYRIKKVMDKYHDIDEFIFHISKVQFSHFYDNFYFFINQLFNAYKANTLGGLNLDNNQEKELENEEENEDEDEENNEESDNEENKSYDKLLSDYNNLKKKYNALMRNREDNNINNNNINNNSKASFKKINPELASLPGETTFGSIKTDTHKIHKFKASLQNNNNNSTSNIKMNDNLTISNDYNEDDKYERNYYTPDHYDDEDSFNDAKDKRYSYSSIHSDEYSKYFDNEQPKHRFKSLNNKKTKGLGLSKGTKKNKIFEYSPSIEIEKQSRENSTKRNNINESQNERINNLSVIKVNRSGIEEQEDIFDKKRIEEIAHDKYVNNFSKDLRIVKNNKILLKNEKQEEKSYRSKNFDDKSIFKQKENIIELKAKKKTDEQKMKDIFNNKTLFEKIKSKLEKDNEKYRHNNIVDEEKPSLPYHKDNRFKILMLSKRTKENYLTIKQSKEKMNKNELKASNENNFEIKNEYYYIESKDSILPEIIEQKIKETNLMNQPINVINEFKEDKTILFSGSNFNIKGKEHKYVEDIEYNELTILNKEKKRKKKNEINKTENIKIKGQPKKWNLSKDLNPIFNNKFSLNNEDKLKDKLSKENNLYIEANELQVIDKKRKQSKKEKINIQLSTKEKQLFKCNENSINIKPIRKSKMREIKITTKKILKHEKIISRKKFLKNQHTSENSFFIKGNKTSLIDLGISKNGDLKIKRNKKKTKNSSY